MTDFTSEQLYKSRRFHESIIANILSRRFERPVVIVLDLLDAHARKIYSRIRPECESEESQDGFVIMIDEPDFALNVLPAPSPEKRKMLLDAPADQRRYVLVFVADGKILVSEHGWNLKELSREEAAELAANCN